MDRRILKGPAGRSEYVEAMVSDRRLLGRKAAKIGGIMGIRALTPSRSELSLDGLARSSGATPCEVHEAVRALVSTGYLTPSMNGLVQLDGQRFDLTLPMAGAAA